MFHILVVDDDKNIRKLIKAVLEAESYTVFTAEDGEMALSLIEQEHIDLVILDIMMPKLDGYSFTKILRKNNNLLPILMVSAKSLPQDIHDGFIAGTDDYMTKPIDMEELLLRIKALLRRAQITSEHKISVGQVTLNYDSFTVTRGDENIVLPQKEFLLLYKLLSYPDKIFTKNQLMEEFWGADSDTGYESLTVHIGRLRKHFEQWDDFSIESIRGLGYKAVKKNG